MKKRFGLAVACVAGLVLAGAGMDGSKPEEVMARDLTGGTVIVVGTLVKPMGTYMNVEGGYFGKAGGLYVTAIDTLERGAAIVIQVDDRGLAKPLEAGRRYRLRGYETGRFGGLVDDPQNPPTKEEMQQRQSAGPYTLRFETVFYVTKAEDLGPASGAKPATTPSATQAGTQPAESTLRQVKLTAGMPRQQAEQLVEAATGVKSTYDLHAMDTSREVTYRQGPMSLIVQYKPGTPAPIIANPDGTRTGLPPVDAEVLSWRIEEAPATTQTATRPPGQIQTEIRGRLVFQDSRYRVVVRPQEVPAKDIVFDLWVTENKILVGQLQELLNQEVVVKGEIVWMPRGATIQSNADYTLGLKEFDIQKAGMGAAATPAVAPGVTPDLAAEEWSKIDNEMQARVVLSLMSAEGNSIGARVEFQNVGLDPLMLSTHPHLTWRLVDAKGEEVATSTVAAVSNGEAEETWMPVLRNVGRVSIRVRPLGFILAGHDKRLLALQTGTWAAAPKDAKTWALGPGEYVLSGTVTCQKKAEGPANQWAGELELPAVRFRVPAAK